jgi:transmembrane sensor
MPPIKEERLLALITNYLAGDLTEEEQLELRRWVLSDPGNGAFLSKLTNKESLRIEIERWKNIEPSAGHDKWLKALGDRERGKILRITRWAAAACLAVGAAGFWLFRSPVGKLPLIPAQTAIARPILPGRNTAVLTLSDGREVLLDSSRNGDLAMEGNARLVKLDSGSLSYIPSGKDKNEGVTYNTLSTPHAGVYRLILPDGSRVWLNSASSIRFPVTFGRSLRQVELYGEAYFEVKRAGAPFKVIVQPSAGSRIKNIIEVLGTHFNVQAYSDESVIKTTLLQGAIRVYGSDHDAVLHPGEQALMSDHLQVLKQVDTAEAVSWKEGLFQFKSADIQTVMRQIARWYDVEVKYEGPMNGHKLTAVVGMNTNLSEVLEILAISGYHFRIEGRSITVLP